MLTPHKMSWGTTIYLQLPPLFNLELVQSLKCLVLSTIRMLLLECSPFKKKFTGFVNSILRKNDNNDKWRDPWFCMVLNPKRRWVSTFGFQGINAKRIEITINFERYLIKWHFCDNFLHLYGNCYVFNAQMQAFKAPLVVTTSKT
jgi:hypothetical protein